MAPETTSCFLCGVEVAERGPKSRPRLTNIHGCACVMKNDSLWICWWLSIHVWTILWLRLTKWELYVWHNTRHLPTPLVTSWKKKKANSTCGSSFLRAIHDQFLGPKSRGALRNYSAWLAHDWNSWTHALKRNGKCPQFLLYHLVCMHIYNVTGWLWNYPWIFACFRDFTVALWSA